MTSKQQAQLVKAIRRAQELAAKIGDVELPGGGDVASMLGGIANDVEDLPKGD